MNLKEASSFIFDNDRPVKVDIFDACEPKELFLVLCKMVYHGLQHISTDVITVTHLAKAKTKMALVGVNFYYYPIRSFQPNMVDFLLLPESTKLHDIELVVNWCGPDNLMLIAFDLDEQRNSFDINIA